MAVTKMQISPVIVNGFENGYHRWIQRIFLVVEEVKQESSAVADKPARRLRKVCTVYVRALGL